MNKVSPINDHMLLLFMTLVFISLYQLSGKYSMNVNSLTRGKARRSDLSSVKVDGEIVL